MRRLLQDGLARSEQTSVFSMLCVFIAGTGALILLISGCLSQNVSSASKVNTTPLSTISARDIKHAVLAYLQQGQDMEDGMRRSLAALVSCDGTEGQRPGEIIIGDWTYDPQSNTMTDQGAWLGNEHVWHEVTLQVSGPSVFVRRVTEKREYARSMR